MKNKTNISVKDIRGVRITPSIELGHNQGYTSGDLLDANATAGLVKQKINEVIGGADSAFDTLKELEDFVKQINADINRLDSKIDKEIQDRIDHVNSIETALKKIISDNYEELKSDINRIDGNLEELVDQFNEFKNKTSEEISNLQKDSEELHKRITDLEEDVDDILDAVENRNI